MLMLIIKKRLFVVMVFVILVTTSSCELFDKHKPPNVKFKAATDFTSGDATVSKGATVKVGIIADKTEDDLKTYNISYSYDGATSTTTKETFTLASGDSNHYEKDYEFTARSQAGTEKWYFIITDRDGNIAKLSFTLTVN